MSRRIAPAMAALALVGALAACAAQPDPRPITREEKVARLQADVDTQWQDVAAAHADLELGDPPPVTVVEDGDQLRERQECFERLGVDVRVNLDGSVQFGDPAGDATPMEVANIACWSAVVPESQLEWIWSDSQQQAVWLYQVAAVECLERFGMDIPEPLPYARQLTRPESVYFLYSSEPFERLRPSEWEALNEACPGMPRWLPQ